MIPPVSGAERALRAEVRHTLGTAEVRALLTAHEPGTDLDPRPLYRLLGARRMLAVHWPVAYGGRGRPAVEHAAVVEELTSAGVPDTLHTLSVQIVGSVLLSAASVGQRARWLPPLADGTLGAAVLYSEPAAGSDLTALGTRAVAAPEDGWRITGRKVYGVKTRYAGLGLCLARTADAASPYQGLTLFLVPLDAPGVDVRAIGTDADEQYAEVVLDGVRVGPDAVLGTAGRAWPLVTAALALERTGVDTAAKARRWLAAAGRPDDPDLAVSLGRLRTRVDAAALLSRRAGAAGAALSPDVGARTKVWCAETARDVAWWAGDVLGTAAPPLLRAAYREAPGLTLSAGTSEVLLDLVAAGLSDRPAEPSDPVAARLALAVRSVVAGGDPQWTELARIGLFGLTVPVDRGGYDLGLGAAAVACAELGRAGVDGGLLDALAAADELPLDRVLAGERVAAGPSTSDRVRTAAWLTGLAAGALALTVARTRERRQFGRAVIENQAVAHRLARIAIALDAVGALVAAAETPQAAAGALATAAELAADAVRTGVQLHGAYGTTSAAPIGRLAALLPDALARAGRLTELWRRAADQA